MVEKNRLAEINEAEDAAPDVEMVELSESQGVAVHLLQEREQRQNTVLEMNAMLNELDAAQAAIAQLRRALYQERLNNISRENSELRKQYELPVGSAKYEMQDGKMFLIKEAAPAPQLPDEGK